MVNESQRLAAHVRLYRITHLSRSSARCDQLPPFASEHPTRCLPHPQGGHSPFSSLVLGSISRVAAHLGRFRVRRTSSLQAGAGRADRGRQPQGEDQSPRNWCEGAIALSVLPSILFIPSLGFKDHAIGWNCGAVLGIKRLFTALGTLFSSALSSTRAASSHPSPSALAQHTMPI